METINFTLNERYRKIIDKIKNQAGLTTDQEVLKYLLDDVESQALEPILVEKVNEEQELEEGSSDRIESNMMIYRDEFADDTRILLPITHEDHGLITKGMIDLLHNKIFPVAYVLYDLDYWLKSRNKTWINLEF